MRKHSLKDVALGMVIMALVVGLTVPALAAVKTLQANYMDIKLVVDGEAIVPKDVSGTVVEPFAVDGTTYLPVRAVGEALQKEVTWDGNTNTVYIGEVPAGAMAAQPEGEVQWSDRQKEQLEYVWRNGVTANIAKLPHTSKVLEETGAEVRKGQEFFVIPTDIGTNNGIYVQDGYGDNEIWIKGLQNFIGQHPEVQDQDYLKILKAILLDIVPDEADARAIGEKFEKLEELCKPYIYSENGSAEEAEAWSAIEAFEASFNTEYNSVKTELTKDWMGEYLKIRLK